MDGIELSTVYLPLLDEVYKNEVKTSVLDGDEVTVKKGQNGEIKIAKLDMDGLGDFSRKSGYTEGNTQLKWETVKYDKERSQKLKVDRLDNKESLGLMLAKLSSEFLRTKVAPETDAARIAKIASTEGISSKEEDITTGDEMYKALRAGINKMDEDEVPTTNRILFITPTGKAMIDDLETYKSKSVMSRFSQVIEVPQTRMYSKVTLEDGTSKYGYKKADDAVELNFLIVERSSTVTAMEQYMKYFSPDEDQESDSHIFPYRNYNLYGYVYENKKAGVYVSKKKSSNIAKIKVSVPSGETSLNLGEKTVQDLCENLSIDDTGNVTGALKHVENWTEFSKTDNTGNFIPLYFEEAKGQPKGTIKCELKGTGAKLKKPVSVDEKDGLIVFQVHNKDNTIEITSEGKETKILTLTSLELREE